MQHYNSSILGFSIFYPEHWTVVPGPWIKQFIGRASGTSEKWVEYLAAGSPPFLIAQDPTVAEGLAIPAVKCKAYSTTSIAAAGGIQLALAGATEQLKQAFPDLELRDMCLNT
jgi:hypothetical protein